MGAIVNNLNGYLHSLRRLSGNKCDFWAERVEIETDIDNTIDEYFSTLESNSKVLEIERIDYSTVEKLLDTLVFSNLNIKDGDLIKLFAWDIVEYYGLASTAVDPEREFNPLVSNGAIKVSVQSDFHNSCVYYVVQITSFAIFTGLAIRA